MKKLAVALGFIALGLLLAPVIPMPVSVQRPLMSALYADKSYADDMAESYARIVLHPGRYGLGSREAAMNLFAGKQFNTAEGGSRFITVEPVLLGDIGWPDVIDEVSVRIVWKRDGKQSVYRYRFSDLAS